MTDVITPTEPPGRLIPAQLHWHGDQPVSRQFGDIYHAPDGAAEVERVFIAPQHLAARFNAARGVFTVGELGFGSALNFAVVGQRFLDHAPAGARLHFISVEKHPLRPDDFARAAANRRTQLPLYGDLLRHYPPLLAGWHRRHLAGGRICLSVFFGDAQTGLDDIVGRQHVGVLAWLLDGFAPAQNPQLWSDALWQRIARLSGPATTVATFTAAGAVRRGLGAAGFSMRKVDQRPHKRHSLAGTYGGTAAAAPARARAVVVVGAGLAGAATARQIAERGIAVTVLDRATEPPNRMAATVLHCRLLPNTGAAGALRCASFNYATAWYDDRHTQRLPRGLLQLPSPGMNLLRLTQAAAVYAHTGSWVRAVDAHTASALAGRRLNSSGLFFPHGRCIDLEALCRDALQHPLIEYRTGVTARAATINADSVRIATRNGVLEADHIVLCAAAATNSFTQARYLELVDVAGQIDPIELARPPAIPILGDGFLAPLAGGWGVGATYEHQPWPPQQATAANLQRFARWWRGLTGDDTPRSAGAPSRGSRAVASDRRPIVGGAYDIDGQRLPRLLLNTGHGSQGTASAPFAAECIASELAGEFAPATRTELATISSLRFRLRQARRGLRHGARHEHEDASETPV